MQNVKFRVKVGKLLAPQFRMGATRMRAHVESQSVFRAPRRTNQREHTALSYAFRSSFGRKTRSRQFASEATTTRTEWTWFSLD